MAKYYNINPETCTKEELEEAIIECGKKEDFFNNAQLSTKIAINSIYGVFGTQYYSLHSTNIAEAITLQGQDLIKYSVNVIDNYFKNIWPSDIAAHHKVAEYMKNKFPEFNTEAFINNAKIPIDIGETSEIYGDTDSAYITVHPFIKAYQIPLKQQVTFCLAINDCILTDYLDKAFNEYAKKYNCPENKEKFELEKIARSVIMLAKKKYIMDIGYAEPGVFHDPLHKLTIKGIEAIQGSIPEFCRSQIKDFIKFILLKIDQNDIPAYDVIINKIKDIKSKFALQSPNEISKSFKISDYDKYVLNDKHIHIEYGAVRTLPMHIKAAARYNNMLYTTAKRYRSKYNTIKTGDKVKFYYTIDGDAFAFIPDAYPIEFAPSIDIDIQFEKMVLDPLNRIIEVIGYDAIPANLAIQSSLW